MLLLGLQSHRLQQTFVGLLRHVHILFMEEVAGQKLVAIAILSLSLGRDGRDEHLVEQKFNVGNDIVQLVGRVEHAENKKFLITWSKSLKELL